MSTLAGAGVGVGVGGKDRCAKSSSDPLERDVRRPRALSWLTRRRQAEGSAVVLVLARDQTHQ